MKFDTVALTSDSIDHLGEPSSSIIKREADMTLALRRKDRTGIRHAKTLLYVAMNVVFLAVMRGQTAQYDSRNTALMAMQIPSLIKLANAGSTDAEIVLGERYLTGSGCKKDAATAAAWWREAASKNNGEAYSLLGKLYESGALGKPDYAESIYWYAMSSQTSPPAQRFTGDPGYADVLNKLSESVIVAAPIVGPARIQPTIPPALTGNSTSLLAPTAPPITDVHSPPSPPPPPPVQPDDDEKAEKIADLQRQYQDLEDDANIIENSVEQYGRCTGMFSAICDAHNAKELRKAKEDRQEMEKIRRKLATLGASTEPDQ